MNFYTILIAIIAAQTHTFTQYTHTHTFTFTILCKLFLFFGGKKTTTTILDTHNSDQSHAGTTLANLKKQRAQSRNSGTSENGSLMGGAPQSISSSIIGTGNGGSATGTNSGVQSMELSLLSSTNDLSESTAPTITKFSGVTSDVVSDSTRSRRCCVVM